MRLNVLLGGAGRFLPYTRRRLAPALRRCPSVNLTVSIGPLIALIAGILILIVPRLLNYIVAIYLILVGLLGLFGGRLHI